jgi:hypothetical protein
VGNLQQPSPIDSLEELLEWPKHIFLALFGDGVKGSVARRRRFESVLGHGTVVHTDFSGKGSVEQAFRMMDVTVKDPNLND